jgi:hypothetical protein
VQCLVSFFSNKFVLVLTLVIESQSHAFNFLLWYVFTARRCTTVMLIAKRITGKNTEMIARLGVSKRPNSYISTSRERKKLIDAVREGILLNIM